LQECIKLENNLRLTVDNMASKGLRAIFYQVTLKVEAGYKPSQTAETRMHYIICVRPA
jgi:hypothetical protein